MMNTMQRLSSLIRTPIYKPFTHLRTLSTKSTTNPMKKNGNDEWNAAWESAWLPEDLSAKNRAPWETDVNFALSDNHSNLVLPSDVDAETKAFVEDMTDNWDQRRHNVKAKEKLQQQDLVKKESNSLYSVENMKKDYRLKKQRIHAGLWMKEIEKQEEAKLGDSIVGGGDDIERLLDSCSEIFDSANNDGNNSKIPSTDELKNKPNGWEQHQKLQMGIFGRCHKGKKISSSKNLSAELLTANSR